MLYCYCCDNELPDLEGFAPPPPVLRPLALRSPAETGGGSKSALNYFAEM